MTVPFKQLGQFVATYIEWLGDDLQVVEGGLSQARADTCKTCPKNTQGHWWEQSKKPVAAIMRRHIEAKNHAKLSVEGEEKLFLCSVCGCCLPLKVHLPIKHILSQMPDVTLAQFPENCWITKER